MSELIYANERLGLYVGTFTGPATMGQDRRMYQITCAQPKGVAQLSQTEFERLLRRLNRESDNA